MPSERTPLIATVPVARPRPRYPHNVVRRFCTIALSSTLIAFCIFFFSTVVFGPDHRHRHHDRWSWPGHHGSKLSYEELKEVLLRTPDARLAEKWSKYYTSGPHLAGQNYSQAAWTRELWEEWGVTSHIATYECLLNYPEDHRVALLERSKSEASHWKVSFEASLDEDALKKDPTTGLDDSIPTFHGYSASGNVTAPVVYVNYGSWQDYNDLVQANVSLEGKIAIARYGGMFRGLKVKRAQELGMVGVLIYTDPGDDGDVTDENGVTQYPKGPARQPSSVQRGSVQFLSVGPGDPTTPGYPSKPGAPRESPERFIPSIPSIPLSYVDAVPILKALNGHGPKAKNINRFWKDKTGLGYLGVDYNIGPTPDEIVVNLYNKQRYVTTPIWNVIGVINGSISDEVIVVGNHRDAWIAGGAADPNSGSAVINEVIRSFGQALNQGWKPLRTIVFASWDGEEYGLVGSTEWVEEYVPWLKHANVAYLNVDVGVKGRNFDAAAAPLLNQLLYDVTAQVPSPNQTVKGQTVRDTWNGRIRTMGSGSDFTAFQDHAGIPSLDAGFNAGADDAVYHYHSNYDSFHWMSTYGDPGFVYHRAMAQILGLLTAALADEPLVAFRATDYADALQRYVDSIKAKLAAASLALSAFDDDTLPLSADETVALRTSTRRRSAAVVSSSGRRTDFEAGVARLDRAVWHLKTHATDLDALAHRLRGDAAKRLPWWKWPKELRLGFAIRAVNSKYKQLERNFLYDGGLDGREWFKHVVFAPGLWTGYAGAVFPGLVESIDDEDWENALRWLDIIEGCILKAAKSIV